MDHLNKIIVILGPTASGKSDLAVQIAKKIKGAEIVSADSRQIYRGLDIVSGKITKKEMNGIPHHLLDVASLKKIFTVAQYQKLSDKAIKKILAKGRTPIICGGTGFYINAITDDLSLPSVPPQGKLRAKLELLNTDTLFKKLSKLDPQRAANIDRYNRRRLIRALEIRLITGKAVPPIKKNNKYQVLKIGINLPPDKLKERINLRLKKRLKSGMIKEITKLHKQGVSWKRLDDLGLECRYISRYLRGLITYDEMVSELQKEIWQYAKRQMTWFKKDKNIIWINDPRKAYVKLQGFLAP